MADPPSIHVLALEKALLLEGESKDLRARITALMRQWRALLEREAFERNTKHEQD